MKNYRFLGEEMEVLGQRLDAARQRLTGAKSAWAKQYWQLVVNQMLFRWQQLPILHDGDAQVTIIPRWTVTYDYFEDSGELGYDFTDKVFDNIFRNSLDQSWENHRAQRLARAQ